MKGTVEFISEKENRRHFETQLAQDYHQEERTRLQLLLELLSTLNVEQLLEIFFHHLQEHMACDSLGYFNEELGSSIELGDRRQARHRAEYSLVIGKENLGKIHFHRAKPFSERELQRIEVLLSNLMLPLRNAIHYQQAMKAATKDPLTGLDNRRSFEESLQREVCRARREEQPLGLMVVDVDWFKRINDEIGHLAGDQVLAEVGATLRDSVRRSDMVFRYAGDEFVLLLPHISEEGIKTLKTRLEKRISELRCHYHQQVIRVSVSIGTAILHGQEMDGQQLFEAADLDMLEHKERHHRENPFRTQRAG